MRGRGVVDGMTKGFCEVQVRRWTRPEEARLEKAGLTAGVAEMHLDYAMKWDEEGGKERSAAR